MANQPTPPQPAQPPQQVARGPAPVGHNGGVIVHLMDLVNDLRAKDWGKAFSDAVDALSDIRDALGGNLPQPQPALMQAAGQATADQVAAQIEQHCKPLQQQQGQPANVAGQPAPVGAIAIPWNVLIPLLLQALQAILARQ